VTVPGNEAELLTRVVSGDREAFDAVMRQHQDRVFSVCLRILGDRERALDATQDTFLTVFRKAGQFQGRSAVGTWIYRIAVNTCYDQLRRAQRRPSEPLADHVDPSDLTAEQEMESAALRPEIEAALAQLPRDFRNAVVLSDL
jgi:RNA polymerase sigma-70 factor (ECF subfamily)